ncbi:MFS transporter [Coprobacillus sp. AM29-13]|jgi:OHS family lactose permease-like MFS transporter|uniref:MFS transporter n=1 Tax=Faecalibacillus intestinalis TaxID=1982626 RepID=A0A7I8E2P6_9FIRM|nr:MFS transporter [Faecalibacillus intestinalis]RHR19535.1 MFS transporter [Coprobacillus sp. AF19-3]RHT54490.1 MFS transporter [Coprobacillus sp. AM29-13]BCL59167.1 MFS transporter [Faecalibacillus intestinalis]
MLERYKNSYLSYFLMYNFYYLSWAIFSALISIYLLDKGFKASEVSLVVSTSFLTSMIFQPVIGMFSDRYDVKKVNFVLFTLAGIGGLAFMFASSLITITIGYSFVLTLINGTNPVMEKIASSSPYQYGKIRIWGTIGYATGSWLAGMIYQLISPSAIFICFIITMILCIIGLLGTQTPSELGQNNEEKTKTSTLFHNYKYLYYLIIAAIFQGITNMANTYIPAMFQNDGLKVSLVSTILSFAVLCEAPLVLFSHKFMDKLTNKRLLIIAYSMITIQFLCYALNVWLPLKVIITLITKHPSGMLFIMINLKIVSTLVPKEHQITALAFVQTLRNLSSIIFQNIAGQILDISSYQILFALSLIVIVVGFVLVILFKVPSGKDQKLFN